MTNFATVEDVEKVLLRRVTDADELASVNWALTVATDAIKVYTDQTIEKVEDDEIIINGPVNSDQIILPQIPVLAVSSVYEDDDLLTVDDDYKVDLDLGIIYRLNQVWSNDILNLTITYNHGYDPIPDTINGICARAASRLFQAALKSQENEGLPGVSSKSLGDFSVSFAVDNAEGMMGASSARVLLFSEKDLLDKYKAR